MRRVGVFVFLLVLAFGIMSFAHKFYVGIFQVNYASDKKMLQITTRIFVDDLNNALGKKYRRKFYLGEKSASAAEVSDMNKYVQEHFRISVNGKTLPLEYRSFEMENNVLIGYYRITSVESVKSLHVTNKILFDYVTEQQNIIQTRVGDVKQNLLLTVDEPSGILAF